MQPDGRQEVDIALPASPDCGAAGAICTGAGGRLETPILTRVRGPAGLTVADARVHEGPGATLAFAVTLGRATSATVVVADALASRQPHRRVAAVELQGRFGLVRNRLKPQGRSLQTLTFRMPMTRMKTLVVTKPI